MDAFDCNAGVEPLSSTAVAAHPSEEPPLLPAHVACGPVAGLH